MMQTTIKISNIVPTPHGTLRPPVDLEMFEKESITTALFDHQKELLENTSMSAIFLPRRIVAKIS